MSLDELSETIRKWSLENSVRPPARREIERTHSALAERYATAEYNRIFQSIPANDRALMLASLAGEGGSTSFATIRKSITGSGRDAFFAYARKLHFITSLNLPHAYLSSLESSFINTQDERMRRYEPKEIRRFSDVRKVAMYAAYLHRVRAILTDKIIRVMLDAVR